MTNLADNNLIKFKNITKKKDSVFVNFNVKKISGGIVISSTIAVDISSLELHSSDTLEKIIIDCAQRAIKEIKKTDFVFEDFSVHQNNYLGVAQLG
jgi:hypothetical protein